METILDNYFQDIIAFCKKADDQLRQLNGSRSFETPSPLSTRSCILLEQNLHLDDLTPEILFSEAHSAEEYSFFEPEPEPVHHRGRKAGPWTPKEEELLENLVKTYKRDWKRIRQRFNKMARKNLGIQFLKDKFNEIKPCESLTRKRFSSEEDRRIVEMVGRSGYQWFKIAEEFPDRDWYSIKNRYYYLTRKGISSGAEVDSGFDYEF